MKTISAGKAVLVGILAVHVPIWALLAIPPIIAYLRSDSGCAIVALPAGFAAAWLWWSLSVPRWRLWAYRRVSSVGALKRAAFEARLTWPDGSFFEKTEIKSKRHALREKQLAREHP
ncbi:MAG: hypothetical protein KGJ55_02945 [Gammaproteobacteria bacterium]|nr:hypothetical protein [Gammaproteobacteria bacterium]